MKAKPNMKEETQSSVLTPQSSAASAAASAPSAPAPETPPLSTQHSALSTNESHHAKQAAIDALHAEIVGVKIGLDNVGHAIMSRDVDAVQTHWKTIVERLDRLAAGITQHLS